MLQRLQQSVSDTLPELADIKLILLGHAFNNLSLEDVNAIKNIWIEVEIKPFFNRLVADRNNVRMSSEPVIKMFKYLEGVDAIRLTLACVENQTIDDSFEFSLIYYFIEQFDDGHIPDL